MHEYKTIALVLPFLASISAVGGQILYKNSTILKQARTDNIIWLLALGMGNLLFILSIVLNFFAMRYIPLFIVYAFTAMNYVFITIASRLILKEKVKTNNILASLIISVGVFLTTIK